MNDDPNTSTNFEGSLKTETAAALCALLGFDPMLPIARCAVVTALGQLPREAKDDVIQFLSARGLGRESHDSKDAARAGA